MLNRNLTCQKSVFPHSDCRSASTNASFSRGLDAATRWAMMSKVLPELEWREYIYDLKMQKRHIKVSMALAIFFLSKSGSESSPTLTSPFFKGFGFAEIFFFLKNAKLTAMRCLVCFISIFSIRAFSLHENEMNNFFKKIDEYVTYGSKTTPPASLTRTAPAATSLKRRPEFSNLLDLSHNKDL